MSTKIRVLDDKTINQIAAGEVIENPASVIKELVENSIDAGSTEICVEIKAGGRQLIRVTDNGSGMSKDDAILCLERHATSKLKTLNDLSSLYTMGFRGEALPSIASISKFSILTSDEITGSYVQVEGGKLLKCSSAQCSRGTAVEVKDIFYNVPVRKQFLKSPVHDEQEIVKLIQVLALGNLKIKWTLICNQERIFQTLSDESLEQRIEAIFGRPLLKDMRSVEACENDISIKGFVGLPTVHKANRTGQTLFINGRPIHSLGLSYAVKDAYATALPQNRHPVFVLHLSMPSDLVDINVHPQKREARFRKEEELKEFIKKSVAACFGHTYVSVESEKSEALPFASYQLPPLTPSSPTVQANEEIFEFIRPSEPQIKVAAVIEGYAVLQSPFPGKPAGLCLVDLQHAQRRILYEKFQNKGPLEVQSLLIPYPIEADELDCKALEEVGIHVRLFGKGHYLLEAVPAELQHVKPEELILGLQKEKDLALAVCKMAAGKYITTLFEAQKVVETLVGCQNSSFCPFGKAIIGNIPFEEVAKKFHV